MTLGINYKLKKLMYYIIIDVGYYHNCLALPVWSIHNLLQTEETMHIYFITSNMLTCDTRLISCKLMHQVKFLVTHNKIKVNITKKKHYIV